MLAKSAGGGGVIALYFGTGLASASGGILFILALWLFGTALLSLIIIGPPVRRALGVGITLDDGGIRLRLGLTTSYWPYPLLGGASQEKRALGTPRLVLSDRTARPVVDVPLLNDAALASAELVMSELRERIADAHRPADAAPTGVERDGRPLSEWCAELDRLAALPEDGQYRERTLDRHSLIEVAGAPGASAETRAGALYVLLKSDKKEYRDAALAQLSEASPPLVLALAERAMPQLPIPEKALHAARGYLESEDRIQEKA